MRSILVCWLLVLLACATSAGPAVSKGLEAELASCNARIAASPEWQALRELLGYPPDRKATPREAQLMTRLHHDYLRPCQEIELHVAYRTHSSLPPLYNDASAKADVEIGRLVRQEITWAEYRRRGVAIRKELNARLEAARRSLRLPSLNSLDRVQPD